MSNTTKHYAKRDPESQGIHYINHVSAMTTEGLHAKSDIAAELAHRDIEIERLRAAPASQPVAVPAGMEPVYQIGQPFPFDPENTWRDASKDAYDVSMPNKRRIIYTESQVQAMLAAARKPLADGVLHALYADAMSGHYADALHYWIGTPAHQYARAIEQTHGIKATNPESNK